MDQKIDSYLSGDEYLKYNLIEDLPIKNALCAFERLRFKIILSQKITLTRDEVITYTELCLLDNDIELPYSLSCDLINLCKNNDSHALFLQAILYEKGILPFGKDFSKAFNSYNDAYKLGYNKASYDLGRCYFNGIGVRKNYDLATSYLKLNLTNIKAKTYLGYIYFCNHNTQGIKLLNEANADEEIESFYYLGSIYEQNNNINKALLYYRTGSDLGEKRCHFKAGYLLYHSSNDYYKKIAKHYLERSKDDKCALELLGDIVKEEKEEYLNYYYQAFLKGADGQKYALSLLENPKTSRKGAQILKSIAKTNSSADFYLFKYYKELNQTKTAKFYLKRAVNKRCKNAIEYAEEYYPSLLK